MALDLRPSPIAGVWYEGDPAALAASVDQYLDRAVLPDLPGEVMGVIAPHAGHIYSGPVAGHAFAALRGRSPELVVVLSPYHNYHSSPLLVTSHEAYETPLGVVPVDHGAVQTLNTALQSTAGMGLMPIAHDREHSLEIELPFLQRALKSAFQLLPVMVRTQEPGTAMELGKALAESLKGRDFILVASTDLSHFYDQRTAGILDAEMLHQIESFSP
ncbi:MAG TPA: AmmeMemoRadiSam system protein B, partial [Anaerolineales bacterium]